MDAAERSFREEDEVGIYRYLMPLLGPSKVFARIEDLKKGSVSARLHSHSALDEFYVILQGRATLRMNGKTRVIGEGEIISKLSGPDLSSQIIADQDSVVRILDIEVWPDSTRRSKDVVFYPDHNELLFRGSGWESKVPESTAISPADFDMNYESGYWRNKDGTWVPKDIPGYRKRT